MPDRSDIAWFKEEFQSRIEPALAGTPLGVDMIAAIACQETGHIWPALRRKSLPAADILALCVGDTLDADKGRRAFPKTKAELLAMPRGDAMFGIARQALVRMAAHVPGYTAAAGKPNKFCHGFGMFQYDLQFFLVDPDFFLQKKYELFEETLGKCVAVLAKALRKLGLHERERLSDLELAAVGITYNSGGFKPAKGLKQGHFDGKRYYGEQIFDFIRLSQTVAPPGGPAPLLVPPPTGEAIVAAPTPVTASGPVFRVLTRDGVLRLRSAPLVSTPPQANVIGHLPEGHLVRAVSGAPVKGFMEVETRLLGAWLHGFASARFLVADPGNAALAGVDPESHPMTMGIPEVAMPRAPGRITKRSDPAGAHSLNEPGQPGRAGRDAGELRAELAAIIEWLAVDQAAHKRYQPHDGLSFCNIYCHDYCHLADVYLPRVWWTAHAIVSMSAGVKAEPLIGDTIVEMRANDLFRWLRDFGPAFGWRQTGTATKLQQAANQGAIALIAARRKEDGRSGHIVVVAPETATDGARRDAAGEVNAPLQSQAGARNFRLGTGKAGWWNAEEFAESAFWIHA